MSTDAATAPHIHRWVDSPQAEPDEWWCAVNDCDARYPKGWTVGDAPTVATTAHLITAVRDYKAAEADVAEHIRALRGAQRRLSRARAVMHEAGASAGVDNAIPSRRWPDVIEWVRLTGAS